MDSKKIKQLLAGVSLSTLLAGGGLVGCAQHGTTSCSGCGGTEKTRSSCGGSSSGSSCAGTGTTSCSGQTKGDDTDEEQPKSKWPTPCGGATGCGGK